MPAPHHTALVPLRQAPRRTARSPLHAAGLPGAGREPARSLYIHFPFCFHKCHYCDFYSIVDSRDRQEAFAGRLERELRAIAPWAAEMPLETIFVGGGTPTLLRVELWERFLGALHAAFDLSGMRDVGVANTTSSSRCRSSLPGPSPSSGRSPSTGRPEGVAIVARGGSAPLEGGPNKSHSSLSSYPSGVSESSTPPGWGGKEDRDGVPHSRGAGPPLATFAHPSGMSDSACGEFTVECNPETATPELMRVLAEGGVNRISVGAQSFDPRHLKTLERWHDPANVHRALDIARDAGISRLNVDLIYAIPGQSEDDWQRDLDAALALGVDHISCYNLTYEPNTAMTRRLQRGDFEPVDDAIETAMHRRAIDTLRAAGLDRYEVSNFARPGEECRHNLAYWRQRDWLAAGPSASAHVGGHRWKNAPRLETYLEIDDEGFAPIVDHEGVDAGRALAERVMTGLRLREGIDAARLLNDVSVFTEGSRVAERLNAVWEKTVKRGWAAVDRTPPLTAFARDIPPAGGGGERSIWRLTDAGFLFADRVAADLMACIPRAPRAGA